jgi:peptidoglycan/LPS O-acetylase OafA/YrhL
MQRQADLRSTASGAGHPLPASPAASTGFSEPAIDGLRWFAVATVLISHFSPTLGAYADWGTYGVNLFFVLSGFLITTILLRARERIHARVSGPAGELRRFYLRRIFRLWPVYFVVLAAAYAADIPPVRSSIAWHVAFLSNYYVMALHAWPGLVSHLWTLAAEQQFYLIWPAVILLAPERRFRYGALAFFALGPMARLALWVAGVYPVSVIMLPLPCCCDLFAAGAVLGWLRLSGSGTPWPRWLAPAAITGLLAWIVFGAMFKTSGRQPECWIVFDATVQAVGFAALLRHVLDHPRGWLTSFLRWPPWVFLGTISYSIYLLHNFMHRMGPALLRRVAGFSYFHSELAHILYLSGLSIATSVIAYFLLEKPIRILGRKLAG